MSARRKLSRQRGVAVITALLLTTLAITIVASLFWQQQVQVRSIENQRLQLQKQWILRGALDWARLILREDARYSSVDHLGEPWAVPVAETRLDQYVENAGADNGLPDAAISGGIVDAQSRYNLANLSSNGVINPQEVAAFARLLTNLQMNPALAQAAAQTMAAAQPKTPQPQGGQGQQGGEAPAPAAVTTQQSLAIAYVDDLLATPGFTPEMVERLKEFVIVLPRATPVNVNTAAPEVMAARIDTLSVSEAATLATGREKAWFNSTSDFAQRLQGKTVSSPHSISVATNFFLINGNVRLNRAALEIQALIERNGPSTKVVWIREK